MNTSTQQFSATLGREADLAFAELTAVVTSSGFPVPERINWATALFSYREYEISALQQRLGGTIKIAKVITTFPLPHNDEQLVAALVALKPATPPQQKIAFSLSGQDHLQKIAAIATKAIKQAYQNNNQNARFIAGKAYGLSSVQLQTQHILSKGFEWQLFLWHDHVLVAETVAFQDYQNWSKRDYERPYADPFRGMLPPKVARILLNIGMSYNAQQDMGTLLDPFCGEGTILQEGLALGLQVQGADIDEKAITHTKANLAWFLQEFVHTLPETATLGELVVSPIQQLNEHFSAGTINLLVTEPFLGAPAKETLDALAIQKIKRQYSPLFATLLQQAHTVLAKHGILGVVIPSVRHGKFSQILLEKRLIDNCEKFGYTLCSGPFLYSRPDAKIARTIYFFRKLA